MKKVIGVIIICFTLLLSSCWHGKLYNYKFSSGNYASNNEKPLNISIHIDEKKKEKIVVQKFLLNLIEITREEYDAANKNNVIEDLSLKEEERKYFSINLVYIIDHKEISIDTGSFRSFSNKKELYIGSFSIHSFNGQNILLYNYGYQIKLDFNGGSVVLNKE